MKKFLFIIAAVAAVTFVACKDEKKADQENGEDIEALAEDSALTDANTLGEALSKALESEDGAGIQGKIEEAKAYAQQLLSEGKGEEAKGIIEKVQQFLSENADKVTSLVGNNDFVQGALDWVKGIDAAELVDKAKEAVGAAGADAAEAAAGAVTAGKDAVEAAKDATVGKAAEAVAAGKEAVESAVEQGNAAIDAAKEAVKNAPEAAKEAAANKAKEAANDAVDKGVEAVGNLLKKN